MPLEWREEKIFRVSRTHPHPPQRKDPPPPPYFPQAPPIMDRLNSDVWGVMLNFLDYGDLSRLAQTHLFAATAYKEWKEVLPASAGELCSRLASDQRVDANYYLRVDSNSGPQPFLAFVTASKVQSQDTDTEDFDPTGSTWTLCGSKSNRGGAGSGYRECDAVARPDPLPSSNPT